MPRVHDPFRFVLVAVAGWMNQRQLQTMDYLREENGGSGSNSITSTAFPRRGRAVVTWTPSTAGSSGASTRWWSIAATIRFPKKRLEPRSPIRWPVVVSRFEFLNVTG